MISKAEMGFSKSARLLDETRKRLVPVRKKQESIHHQKPSYRRKCYQRIWEIRKWEEKYPDENISINKRISGNCLQNYIKTFHPTIPHVNHPRRSQRRSKSYIVLDPQTYDKLLRVNWLGLVQNDRSLRDTTIMGVHTLIKNRSYSKAESNWLSRVLADK